MHRSVADSEQLLIGLTSPWRQDKINNQWTIARFNRHNRPDTKLWMIDIRGQTRPGDPYGAHGRDDVAMVFQFLTPDGTRPQHGRHHYLWWPYPPRVAGVYSHIVRIQTERGWSTLVDIDEYIMEEIL